MSDDAAAPGPGPSDDRRRALERADTERLAAGRSRPRGGEALPAVAFIVSMLAIVGFVAAYLTRANTQLMGVCAFLALTGIGVGMIVWAKRFMTPPHPEVEPRGQLASSEEEIAAFHRDFELGEFEMERRSLLTKLLGAAVAVSGVGALVTLLSLGPRPGRTFTQTRWRAGRRVVDEDGQPVRADSVNTDGVITVFPEGDVDRPFNDLDQALLIGLQPGTFQAPAGREGWTPTGDRPDAPELVCFSKVCTHAGCPVGLYQAAQGWLICPCHQSTFDVAQACQPIFGPAATPLPQLPLAIDSEGFLIAQGDFSDPPGPGFWNQDR
jgi:ubiquinol-cytochrome c reductase iron-sulfur subunit